MDGQTGRSSAVDDNIDALLTEAPYQAVMEAQFELERLFRVEVCFN